MAIKRDNKLLVWGIVAVLLPFCTGSLILYFGVTASVDMMKVVGLTVLFIALVISLKGWHMYHNMPIAYQHLTDLFEEVCHTSTLLGGLNEQTVHSKIRTVTKISELQIDLFENIYALHRCKLSDIAGKCQDAELIRKQMHEKTLEIIYALSEIKNAVKNTDINLIEQNKKLSVFSQNSKKQKNLINDIFSYIKAIFEGVHSLSKLVTRQSADIEQIGATIEEQAANIRNIFLSSADANTNAERLLAAAKSGQTQLTSTSAHISQLIDIIATIKNFTDVITTIASQTNLLAMNASIEAAHAGEYGKGFAVVANEIRKLADKASKEANNAKSLLAQISTNSEQVRADLDSTISNFNTMVVDTQQVSQIIGQVRNAMDEQNIGNQEMVKAVSDIRNVTAELTENSQIIDETAKDLNTQADSMQSFLAVTEASLDELLPLIKTIAAHFGEFGECISFLDGNALSVKEKLEQHAQISEDLGVTASISATQNKTEKLNT